MSRCRLTHFSEISYLFLLLLINLVSAQSAEVDARNRTAPARFRFNVTVCCVGVGCSTDSFSLAYFTAAVGWWQGRPTLDLNTARTLAPTSTSSPAVAPSLSATALLTPATIQPPAAASNPFDDPQIGLGVGWPRLKVVDFRIMTMGGSALVRDMLRTYTLLDADAVCDLVIGPATSYLAQSLGWVVERPFWLDFSSAGPNLANFSNFARVNPTLDDLAYANVNILLGGLRAALAIDIPSVTILASSDSYSDELTGGVRTKLAALGIEVEFIITLPLDATPQQARHALAELRTARSRIVVTTILMTQIVTLWGYLNDAAMEALAAGQYDFIFIYTTSACGKPPILPGTLCATANLNLTHADQFLAAFFRQPQYFSDATRGRLRAMNWPDVPTFRNPVQLGAKALVIDAVTFGLGALDAFVMRNGRLPSTTAEIHDFATGGYMGPDGISGKVHLRPNGDRVGGSLEVLNYHASTVMQVGVYDDETGNVTIDPEDLYLRGGYYLRPLRTPPTYATEGENTSRMRRALVPAVASVACGLALLAGALAIGCCLWRRRWLPSREERLARRHKWAVRGVAAGNGGRVNGQAGAVAPAMRTACVTVVWTDIEKSTALWAHLPRSMGRAIDAYHALVRALIWAHHGYETRTAGDAFIVVFGNAADALEFAMVLQLALVRDVPWSALGDNTSQPEAMPLAPPSRITESLATAPLVDGSSPSPARGVPSTPAPATPPGGADLFEQFYRKAGGASNPSPTLNITSPPPASLVSASTASHIDTPGAGQPRSRLWAGLRTRIGIATGVVAVSTEPHTGAVDYVGPAVDTAARVCLIARGGQTVMAETSLRAALAHAGLDPGDVRPVVPPGDNAHSSTPPSMVLGWLRPSETVESQVPAASRQRSPAFGVTVAGAGGSTNRADEARLLTPPQGGRAPPYVRPSPQPAGCVPCLRRPSRPPGPSVCPQQPHIFPASTYVRPLGVYGLSTLRGSSEPDVSSGEKRRLRTANIPPRRGLVAYQSLYHALPSLLAGRRFGPLRLKMLPVVKYRDADGAASTPALNRKGLPTSPPPPPPPGALDAAAAVATAASAPLAGRYGVLPRGNVTAPGFSYACSGIADYLARNVEAQAATVDAESSTTRVAPLRSQSVRSPSRGPLDTQAARSAMSVLLQVLLAPVASKERLAILTEIATAWRLPLVQPAPAVRDAAGGFSLVDGPAGFSDVQAIERLARRCADVYMTAQRAVAACHPRIVSVSPPAEQRPTRSSRTVG